jgi:hypothetical protein
MVTCIVISKKIILTSRAKTFVCENLSFKKAYVKAEVSDCSRQVLENTSICFVKCDKEPRLSFPNTLFIWKFPSS